MLDQLIGSKFLVECQKELDYGETGPEAQLEVEFSVAEGVVEHLVEEEGKAVEQAQQEEIVGEIEEEQMPYDALSQHV